VLQKNKPVQAECKDFYPLGAALAAFVAMKTPLLMSVLALLGLLAACGSNGSTPSGTGTGSFSNASLTGSYAYQISGTDLTTGAAYRESGVFTAGGNGNITSGTDDFEESATGLSTNSTTGNYAVANDGTGSLTLTSALGTLDFTITLVSGNEFYLTESDNTFVAAGRAEAQITSAVTAIPSGPFVFRLHTNTISTGSAALVGAITVSGGAVTGSDDVIRGAAFDNNTGAALTLTGTFGAPTNGRGVGSITDSASVTNNFIYYILDSNHIFLMDSDTGTIGIGAAVSQSGAPFSNSSLTGSYAFGSHADDHTGLGEVRTVGVFTAGGNGSISTGSEDSVVDGTSYAAVGLSGTYALASNGRAAVTVTVQNIGVAVQVFYMISPSQAFFLTNNTSKVEDGTIDLQTVSSFSTATLNGQYAFVMNGLNFTPLFLSRVGWISWNGSGSLNWNEVANAGQTGVPATLSQPGILAGSYTAGTNGRVTATVNSLSVNPNDLVFYLISGSSAYVLQNDSGYEIAGAMKLQ
jgi:hypothetical protein